MAFGDTLTRVDADQKARAAGAHTYGNVYPPRRVSRYSGLEVGEVEVMFVHYFNKADDEVAMWSVPLQSFHVFETPRVWGICKPHLKELIP